MDTKNFNFVDRVVARYRLSKVLRFVENDDEILDFGCGARSYLLELSKGKIKYGVGIDYDADNKKNENIEYLKQKVKTKLDFKNNSFNKIYMLAVLEHIEPKKIEKLFLEFKRVLKKNGKIILTTPTPRSKWLLELLAYRLQIISKEEIADHKKYYDKSEIEKLGKKVGLKTCGYELFFGGLNSYAIFKK